MPPNPVAVDRDAFIRDMRAGMDDPALMKQYGLSANQLKIMFDRLVQKGYLARTELEARAARLVKKDKKSIRPDDLRVDGEMTTLYITLGSMAVVMLFLVGVSLGVVLIGLAIVAALIKIKQGQLLGNSVRVSEQQFPKIFGIASESARRLDMNLPDIFVTQNPIINAFAIGFLGKRSVVLHSATVESMTPEELTSILGHELTHIKCNHTTWLALTSVKDQVRVPLVSDILGFIFLYWSRKAEYTSDRGGLVACCDLVPSISALVKVAVGKELFLQMNLDHFFKQGIALDQDGVAKLTELFSSHPYMVRRIDALKSFHESDTYCRLRS